MVYTKYIYKGVKVRCHGCDRWIEEKKIKDADMIDIYSDLYGRDKLVFRCPHCRVKTKSLRYTI